MTSCAECGAETNLAGYSPRAGGALCTACSDGAMPLSPQGLRGIEALLSLPLADAGQAQLGPRAAREALAVVNASHEYHGGFRLRTLAAS